MKITYITFTREMARAYREGRKSMTRRVVKKQPDNLLPGEFIPPPCPYGKPGDQLIFGTTWAVTPEYDDVKPIDLPSHINGGEDRVPIWSYFNGDEKPERFGKLRPARFLPGFLRGRMPRETIKEIRAERVQDITEEDARLEGVSNLIPSSGYLGIQPKRLTFGGFRIGTHREAFSVLIDEINAPRGYRWKDNYWVWVVRWRNEN